MNLSGIYPIHGIFPANDNALKKDVYLVVLYANRVPPHLAVTISGKLFTLTTKGATIEGELEPLLKLIRKNRIATLFIRLALPEVFTLQQLNEEIKKYTLAYPRVDVGLATCLSPIKDFCSSVYAVETQQVNFVFDLLPVLYEKNIITQCYQMNLDEYIIDSCFSLKKYTMNDIFETIRSNQLVINS